jgi:hypothetical protein
MHFVLFVLLCLYTLTLFIKLQEDCGRSSTRFVLAPSVLPRVSKDRQPVFVSFASYFPLRRPLWAGPLVRLLKIWRFGTTNEKADNIFEYMHCSRDARSACRSA